MNRPATAPIVVGIDGSKQAIRAAIWASDEAVSRDTHLRLVHVVDGNSTDLDRDYEFAEHILHKAWAAVENAGKLRKAPLLALTPWGTGADDASEDEDDTDLRAKLRRYLDEAEDDNADVKVCALPMPDVFSNLLEQSADIDQLIIVGADNPELVAEVVGPKTRTILRDTNCSLLILRDRPLRLDAS